MYSPRFMVFPLLPPDRSIVLVGLPGTGKTSVGRRLARRLGLNFADSDEEIERAAGYSVAEIFEKFGEPGFRDGERRVIRRLVIGPPKVVATGGGAFMDEQTRALILDSCISIWIDADLHTLVRRVARRSHRPLLKDRDPAEVLRALSKVRGPVYALARIHIRSEALPHEQTVERIVAALADREPDG